MPRSIDLWVNVTMGEQKPPEWLIRVKEDYFKGGDEFLRNIEPGELVADMDEAGVERAVISIPATNPSRFALRFAEQHPERFAYAVSLSIPAGTWRRCGASRRSCATSPS